MKKSLLFAMAAAFAMGVKAQMTDVTSQYIVNASFEECEALEVVTCMPKYGSIPLGEGVEIATDGSVKKGTDYSEQGWKLVEQRTSANGAVIPYNTPGVRYSPYSLDADKVPTPMDASFGAKALCFTGNKGVSYLSTNEITLPAGSYILTVNVYAANLVAQNNMTETVKTWSETGFIANDGTKYLSSDDQIGKEMNFLSNAWDKDVVRIQLTEEKTGRFQLNYGNSYYVVIDDLKLEYEQKIITDALEEVIVKAGKLYELLGGNADLETAIGNASQFVSNPTSQDAVATEVSTLYAAMANALKATQVPVDITSVYVTNPSFEDGTDGWEGISRDALPDGSPALDFIHGDYYAESKAMSQVVKNLPEGFFMIDAKVQGTGNFSFGGTKSPEFKGGSAANNIFLRASSGVVKSNGVELTIGVEGTQKFKIDAVRLLYGPTAGSLQLKEHEDAKADAQTILGRATYKNVTGNERTAAQQNAEAATEGTLSELMAALNTSLNAFIAAKDNYDNLVKAKTNAASCTSEAYPFAKADLHQSLQALLEKTVSTSAEAATTTNNIKVTIDDIYVSNAYAEGVENRVDYSDNVVASAWRFNNMGTRTTTETTLKKKGYTDPVTNKEVTSFLGTTTEYYNMTSGATAYMEQNVEGLPAGKYVFAATMMAYKDLTVNVKIGGLKKGSYTGVGTAGGGKYGAGWNELVFAFEKSADGNVMLRIEDDANTQFKEWYINNIRIFGYAASEVNGISETVNNAVMPARQCFDLQGRRVAQPTKGLYIVGGKKMLMK